MERQELTVTDIDQSVSTTPAPRPKRGFFGFLFKTIPGCLLTGVVLLLGLVALAPLLAGGLVKRFVEKAVTDHRNGSLVVGDVSLAWFSEQGVRDAVLRDPDGATVARASATLPPLWTLATSGGSKLGRVHVELEADLVANDAGVTNLERALAARTDKPSVQVSIEKPSGDPLERLRELEVELDVVAKRVTWSDAETRALGKPFELRDLRVAASAKPGAPLACTVSAAIDGETPGSIAIDAKLEHAAAAVNGAAWPFGALAAQGRIENFSSALVDGLAKQRGKLKELLGPSFTLTFDARDVTPERGEVSAQLVSRTATQFDLTGRFENGVFRARDGKLLDARIAPPRAYVAEHVVPHLPPGSTLDFGANGSESPWTLRIDDFECALPRGPRYDVASLAPVLEAATLTATFAIPGSVGFDNEEAQRAFGRSVALHGTRVELALAKDTAPHLRCTSTLLATGSSSISIDATSADLWKALASGATPHADANVVFTQVPVKALDAALALDPPLAPLLGATLDVQFHVRDAGSDRGDVKLAVRSQTAEVVADLVLQDGALRTNAGKAIVARVPVPESWLAQALAPHVPADVKLTSRAGGFELRVDELVVPLPASGSTQPGADKLAFLRGKTSARVHAIVPGASWARGEGAQSDVALQTLTLDASLAASGAVDVTAELALRAGGSTDDTRATLRARAADVWALASRPPGAPFPALDVDLDAPALPTRELDAFAGPGERISGALGPKLALHVEARGFDLANGTLAVRLDAERAQLEFAATVNDHVLRTSGEQAFVLSAKPDAKWLAAFLPAGREVTLGTQAAPGGVRCELRGLEVALPDPASTQPFSALALLENARAEVKVSADRVTYADEHTRAAALDVALEDFVFTTALVPKQALDAKLALAVVTRERGAATPGSRVAGAGATSRGTLTLDAKLADPWFALRTPAAPLPPIDAHVVLAGLSTRTLDSVAGSTGMLSGLLGPWLDLDVRAEGASLAGGGVKLDAKSETTTITFAGTLKDGVLSAPKDGGLALSTRVPAKWLEEQLTPRLPAGSKLSAPTDAEPLTVALRGLRVPLASAPGAKANATTAPEPSVFARLAEAAANVEVRVPELVYADAATAASGAPVTIRGLRVTAELAPGQAPFVHAEGALQSEPPGAIRADVRALDALALLGETGGADRFRVSCDVDARGVPTALVDALAKQDGLLVEALGTRLQLTVKSASLSKQAGTFTADLVSDIHDIHCEGALENGALKITKQEGLLARIGLGPIVNEKVVGRVVPMLVNLKKPDGAAPAVLALNGLDFPLTGDLRGLDADVRIDLGEVSYALLPGLEQYFGNAVDLKPTKLKALDVPIRKGVASYKDFEIAIAGHPCKFNGSFDLVDLTLKLDTSLPLKLLGKKASAELERVREYVDPNLAVPLEIRGSWKKPRVSFGPGFVEKVVTDAAKGGLGDLLEGLLKKKKKD